MATVPPAGNVDDLFVFFNSLRLEYNMDKGGFPLELIGKKEL